MRKDTKGLTPSQRKMPMFQRPIMTLAEAEAMRAKAAKDFAERTLATLQAREREAS